MPKQDVAAQLFYDVAWHAADAYVRDPIRITRGRGNEQSEPTPSTVGLTLDNRDGSKNPNNASSSLYGKIGRNTLTRVMLAADTRFVGEAASWQPDRTINFDPAKGRGDAWTTLAANGILRRLQQGRTPLRSPLYRATSFLSPVAWWPLEEEGDATNQGASGLPGGPVFHLDSGTAEYGKHTDCPGAVRAPELIAAKMSAPLPRTTAGTGWAVHFAVKVHWNGTSPGSIVPLRWLSVNGDVWACLLTNSGINIGVELGTNGGADPPLAGSFQNVLDGQWHSLLLLVTPASGSTTSATFYIDGVSQGTNTGNPYTFSELAGSVSFPDESLFTLANVDSVSLSHLAFFEMTTAPTELADATRGWIGETAGNRFLRLCDEHGVTAAVVGTAGATKPMGVQATETLGTLLTEIERTDGGILYEPREVLGLTYRTPADLYNQAATLTLDWDAGNVAPPLKPVADDQATRNDVTVKRRNGSSYVAEQATGPLNVQLPADDPQGVGRTTTEINVNPQRDSDLPDIAGMHLRRGTVAGLRYPQVTVDLVASPDIAAAATAVDIGDRIDLVNLPLDVDPNPVSLIVFGYTETIQSHLRRITFNCAPFEPYKVLQLDDAAYGRLADNGDSTIANGGGINAVTTSISVATPSTLWSTNGADYPSTAEIEGERITVTAVSGASSPQTFTVIRSVNGVVRSHPQGALVTVLDAFAPTP